MWNAIVILCHVGSASTFVGCGALCVERGSFVALPASRGGGPRTAKNPFKRAFDIGILAFAWAFCVQHSGGARRERSGGLRMGKKRAIQTSSQGTRSTTKGVTQIVTHIGVEILSQ